MGLYSKNIKFEQLVILFPFFLLKDAGWASSSWPVPRPVFCERELAPLGSVLLMSRVELLAADVYFLWKTFCRGASMSIRKNALLLFSKVPAPGKVKTRLSVLKDGILAPEWASHLYQCMLFDVVECCCDCVERMEVQQDADGTKNTYDIIISSPGFDQELAMRQLFADNEPFSRSITFIHDIGNSFDEHYNDAFQKVWAKGYDTILSMGCDMPALTHDVIEMGFHHLHELCQSTRGGVVVSPDQEMGVSIVGWPRQTRFDHTGVFYNQSGLTVLPAYTRKCQGLSLPMRYIPAMPDVDTVADLQHNITLLESIAYAAQFQDDLTCPKRTLEALEEYGLTDVRVHPNDLMDPRGEIDG